ncbi:DNA alkylation repair protein [Dyadobacter sp. Leaf189]|uniref:DNA alkylation repair protein n=1 Tax=Dyadobacter sp. Leaf189 TaxID=1736295 RepID=UPI0006FFE2E2|nr:DNA alkylation repair protein [Dyadobacter sp. Leaf189]KQS28314.1 DNA alkylation repair protein [Dyadobacter sp. Leaf189]
MTLEETLSKLEALGSEKMRAFNTKNGAGPNQFGIKLGDIRAVANKIKADHKLALALWDTGNVEARLLATLIMNPKKLSADELEKMVRSERYVQVFEWLYANVVKNYPDAETLRNKWLQSDDSMCRRLAWSLTSGCVARNPGVLDLPALLDTIEFKMPAEAPEVQWTMNSALANIGIHFPEHRERALAIGEKLGIYRDYPVSKGCTSPFAPTWINEIVSRQTK